MPAVVSQVTKKYLPVLMLAFMLLSGSQAYSQDRGHYLETGWYPVKTDGTGTAYTDTRSGQMCYVGVEVAVSSDRFRAARFPVNRNLGYRPISIYFVEARTRERETITGANIGERVAFIFGNRLISAPKVNMPITNGSSSVVMDISERQLFRDMKKAIKRQIKINKAVN